MDRLIDTFRIEKFRGLTNVELRDCGAVNLLIGVNNSGKTSILEALALHCRSVELRTWLDVIRRRNYSSNRTVWIEELVWMFQRSSVVPNSDTGGEIVLWADGRHPVERIGATATRVRRLQPLRIQVGEDEFEEEGQFEERGWQVQMEVTASRLSVVPRPQKLEFWPSGAFIDTPDDPSYREVRVLTPFSFRLDQDLLRAASETLKKGLMLDAISLVGRIDPDVVDIYISTPDGSVPELSILHRRMGRIPLMTQGDGLRRVISIALTVTSLKNGLLLIDEIESAIHVSALATVFPWLVDACKRNNVQLFATTHSLEAVDAILDIKSLPSSDVVAFRLNRSDAGPQAERLSGDLLHRLRFERGLEVR